MSGPVSESLCSGPDYFNFNNANGVAALIGAAQTVSGLSIVSFTDTSGKDHSTPQAEITYTLSP